MSESTIIQFTYLLFRFVSTHGYYFITFELFFITCEIMCNGVFYSALVFYFWNIGIYAHIFALYMCFVQINSLL